ncbi:hypothetical protein D9M72_594850 [compost metagenome]
MGFGRNGAPVCQCRRQMGYVANDIEAADAGADDVTADRMSNLVTRNPSCRVHLDRFGRDDDVDPRPHGKRAVRPA